MEEKGASASNYNDKLDSSTGCTRALLVALLSAVTSSYPGRMERHPTLSVLLPLLQLLHRSHPVPPTHLPRRRQGSQCRRAPLVRLLRSASPDRPANHRLHTALDLQLSQRHR